MTVVGGTKDTRGPFLPACGVLPTNTTEGAPSSACPMPASTHQPHSPVRHLIVTASSVGPCGASLQSRMHLGSLTARYARHNRCLSMPLSPSDTNKDDGRHPICLNSSLVPQHRHIEEHPSVFQSVSLALYGLWLSCVFTLNATRLSCLDGSQFYRCNSPMYGAAW